MIQGLYAITLLAWKKTICFKTEVLLKEGLNSFSTETKFLIKDFSRKSSCAFEIDQKIWSQVSYQ